MAADLAPNACSRCKGLKKKCDKGLPCCARCTRLGTRCQYDIGTQDLRPVQTPSDTDSHRQPHQLPTPPSMSTRQGSPDVQSVLSMLQVCDDDESLGRQIGAVIAGTGADVGIFCSTYFNTLHEWFPIIPSRDIYDRIATLSTGPSPDFAILVLCIHLITKIDRNSCDCQTMMQYYLTAKRFYALVTSSGRASKELIQSGIILALYEYGNAMADTAYVSVAGPARMALLLGYDKTLSEERPDGVASYVEAEEQRCIWWCIIIIERVMRMDSMDKQLPFITESPTPYSLLPSTSGAKIHLGVGLKLPGNPFHDSTPAVRLKTFALVAQSVYFLDRVIVHINTTYEDVNRKSELTAQLDQGIRAFTMSLLEGNYHDRTGHCWPHATCLSALLFLARDTLEVRDGSYKYEDSCRGILALRSVIRITLEGVRSGAYTTQTAVELVPIWGLHCLYLAATSLTEFGDQANKQAWEEDLECLHQTLSWFKSKWMLAGCYLDCSKMTTRILKEADTEYDHEDPEVCMGLH
ncbi:hypothetical protein V495_02761 [Pseudogymnoascus sp. VKM F-4514 (FW-929)]|nr:hypothetical protein V495_02761 [Pseudogymnoascus sp. VKM F-4514 (FW-929)]KFY59410.1 hypothetical protein V497_04322 [Pseudogymnoascus sp. VKM F-4516 (FW-969)]